MFKHTFKTLLTGTILIATMNLSAQDLPVPSPSAEVEQRVGLTDVKITYSRPSVKDRKIFGGLVPYDKMWRTGANKATAMSFSTDVEIAGNKLAAGTYAIFTIPGENEWEIIFNNNTEQWGTSAHKDEEDVLKVKVKSQTAEFTESMLFYFDHLRDESATINLQWEKTKVSIPVSVDAQETAMKNIDQAVGDLTNAFRVYNNSARYYLDNNQDAAKALEWAKKSVDIEKRYWNLTTLSRAQAANKMYKEAMKTAAEAKEMAMAENNQSYADQNAKNIESWKKMK